MPLKESHLILGNDQKNERLVLYDLDRIPSNGFLEDGEVWSVPSGHVSGMAYRENTPFGNVILSVGKEASLISYPRGKVIWSTNTPGRNAHGAELLPDGNLVVVNSTGCDVRLFHTAALLLEKEAESDAYASYPLCRPHGALWDPIFQCLWVLGAEELVSYRVVSNEADVLSTLEEVFRCSLAEYGCGGHDIAQDPADDRYLFCTTRYGVLRFDKELRCFERPFPQYEKIHSLHCKAFSRTRDGMCVYTTPTLKEDPAWKDWWKSGWCTDCITTFTLLPDGTVKERVYRSLTRAFYKASVF